MKKLSTNYLSGWESNQYTDIKGKPYKIVGVYETKNDFGMPMPEGYTSLENALSFRE